LIAYGFAIHPCTPYRPNEKGRVERVIRDIRSFLYTQHPKDLADLNRLVDQWQRIRNNTPHSMTGRSPSDVGDIGSGVGELFCCNSVLRR
jgi:transposase